MSGYTPVFDHIYQGTLFGRWPAAAVWASLLPLCDKNGVISYSWTALSGMTGWPMELLRQGIDELMQPDPGSNSQIEAGKRLVPHEQHDGKDCGWRAVNHGKYRERARKQMHDMRRLESGENAERMRTRRDPTRPARTREHPLSNTNTNTNTNTDKKKSPSDAQKIAADASRFVDFQNVYPKRAGNQPWPRALQAAKARIREGFTWSDLIAGAERYALFCTATHKVGTEFVMQAATFLGPSKPFAGPWGLPATKAETRLGANLSAAEEFMRRTEATG